MKLPKYSMAMALSMADEKRQKKIEAEDIPYIRDGILTGLLADVAQAFNVQLETVQSGDQQQLTVLVRVIFYYVARTKTDYTLKQVAHVAGRKDHASVIIHMQKVHAYLYNKDKEFLTLWDHYLTGSKLFTSKDFH